MLGDMNALILLVIFMIAVYICWNCVVKQSTIILVIVLGIAIYSMAHPGTEKFEESPTISTDALASAGVVPTSLFNCATEIGKTAEMNYIFAEPSRDTL
jgi:hypothetical protein